MDANKMKSLVEKYPHYFSYHCPEDNSLLNPLSVAPRYISEGKDLICPECHDRFKFTDAKLFLDREKVRADLESIFQQENELLDLMGNQDIPSLQ